MIETLSKDNITEFLPLIRKYQHFYQVQGASDEKKRTFLFPV